MCCCKDKMGLSQTTLYNKFLDEQLRAHAMTKGSMVAPHSYRAHNNTWTLGLSYAGQFLAAVYYHGNYCLPSIGSHILLRCRGVYMRELPMMTARCLVCQRKTKSLLMMCNTCDQKSLQLLAADQIAWRTAWLYRQIKFPLPAELTAYIMQFLDPRSG